ncbi:hypothetical protein N7490_004943 [Penicillium lividum]|nr:hypothetical protein N7490_004943 [Penicillium lividum]
MLSPTTDRGNSLFLPDSQLEWRDIPFSDAKEGRRLSDNDNKWYIVDTIEVGPTTRSRDLARDVRILATKLTQANPLAFGLLSCKGVIAVKREHASPAQPPTPSSQLGCDLSPSVPRSTHSRSPSRQDYSHFQFVFQIPDGMEALQSLRQLLLNSDLHISLSRKVRIARELVKAVNYVHTFAFVHKNVRPESVLCFEDPEASRSHAFLVGFDAFRGASTGTMMSGDTSWDRNVYRHPYRQGMDPSEKYPLVLEIGLWEPLVEYSTDHNDASPPQARFGKLYYDFQAWYKQQGTNTSSNAMSFQLKDYLVEQAQTRLASRVVISIHM